ncbi:hypothetical protein [Chryseobacterium sp.]|uniref:hypothetical protein n=1 Tax=Chryseobacterium sp. TaxID=1871047 RepID=UPI002629C118|nr:hypothetical protein [Chryseobacterium sp.]
MSKKKIIAPLILSFVAAAIYFVFFHKDKNLRYIPESADVVVLVDVKKLTRQYIFSLVMHPSHWSGGKTNDKHSASLKDSGIRIPDFLQIFHIKDSGFSEWYAIMELKDQQKFITFLKSRQFTDKGKGHFQKDQIYLRVEKGHFIVGTSDKAFESLGQQLFVAAGKYDRDAELFIDGTLGSVSFISGQKFQNFSIELKDDEIKIKNNSKPEISNAFVSRFQNGTHFLEMELDADNIKKYTRFFNKGSADSSHINYVKARVDLEQVNDTIISYGYDDNFNEIEKKSVQKIIQPDYIIALQSLAPEKTWEYFQAKKWVNEKNEFTAIPFQPNTVIKNEVGAVIQSTKKSISLSSETKENYIFIRNSALLLSSLKMLSGEEKRILSDIDYLLYRNKTRDHSLIIKAKKGELPLLLRW